MTVSWVSYPYRPRFDDPELEQAAGTALEQMCQTEKHMMSVTPAGFIELFFTDEGGPVVHRSWFTCSACHAQLEAEYEHAAGE